MIASVWHGYTTRSDTDAYEAALRAEILLGIKEVPGYLGCYILRRLSSDEVEFLTMLLRESLSALQAFAGPAYEHAIVPGERRRFLLHYDERSAHYQVVVQPACEPV